MARQYGCKTSWGSGLRDHTTCLYLSFPTWPMGTTSENTHPQSLSILGGPRSYHVAQSWASLRLLGITIPKGPISRAKDSQNPILQDSATCKVNIQTCLKLLISRDCEFRAIKVCMKEINLLYLSELPKFKVKSGYSVAGIGHIHSRQYWSVTSFEWSFKPWILFLIQNWPFKEILYFLINC